ncbi:MAG TPA: hypothetical protein VMI35_08540 [Puia sp.]|nr:hypothetical protein [Puia sp.]
MSTQSTSKPMPFLNRLALVHPVDPTTINPYAVLRDIFQTDSSTGFIQQFRESCQSALSQNYAWKEGCPGNLLFLHERLEMLLEACYLIYVQKSGSKKKWLPLKKKYFKKLALPCPLSMQELDNPYLVLESFFSYRGLREWKQDMHEWLEAGLSNQTVSEIIEPESLLPYCRYMEKLVAAAGWLLLCHKKPAA